jgi:hypothetical protein
VEVETAKIIALLYDRHQPGSGHQLLNMFNPLFPFTSEVLQATVQRGGLWFVRNTFDGMTLPAGQNKDGFYLISHYNDPAKAGAHFNSIVHDAHRFLYAWEDPVHRQRLQHAATRPPGFAIYSAYFYPDYKKRMTQKDRDKINRYLYKHTEWKPGGGDTVHVDLYLQFGMLYLHLRFEGQELKIKFADIESLT